LHVPADQAELPLFDGVFVDIGDQQSIEQALSTFSSHISNLLAIIGEITAQSLILVDELGTSTDPEEGSALAQAILWHFLSLGPLLVATTHHRGVARFVQETPGMTNASVDLHPQTLQPTYRVTLGLPGRSYALTIAARLGIPREIIDHARSAISPVEQATEDLLHQLQVERRVVEDLRREAEEALTQSRQQQAEAESQLANVESRKAELVEDARQDLQDRIGHLLARLRRAERVLDQPDTRQVIQEQRAQLREAAREVRTPRWQPIEVKRTPWQERVGSGDRVFLRGIPRPVEVITPADEEGQIEVLLGTMRAKVPMYQLERPAGGHQAAAQASVFFQRQAPKQSNTEIDLRGCRVDEAIERVDELLNNASLDGVENVRIIHGKGTGALRRAIREYLDRHPLAASVAGGEGSGGEGVTVVEVG
jgi:DNA mismatch repair protein MutS2